MKKTRLVLDKKRQLTEDVFELKFGGDFSSVTNCGQFVNFELDGFFLRRPISICEVANGVLTVICRSVGAGTALICKSEIGASFDCLVGLGNGYDIDEFGVSPVLVGGGVGVPPLYWLAKKLIKAGVLPVVALGFSSVKDVFYVDEFKAIGCRVIVSTIDGSYGEKGLVTELIQSKAQGCDYAFCCGPVPMLRAVYELKQIKGGQFSFEERMGCGFGACMGCTCKTKYGYKRICEDGPVLKMEEIVW